MSHRPGLLILLLAALLAALLFVLLAPQQEPQVRTDAASAPLPIHAVLDEDSVLTLPVPRIDGAASGRLAASEEPKWVSASEDSRASDKPYLFGLIENWDDEPLADVLITAELVFGNESIPLPSTRSHASGFFQLDLTAARKLNPVDQLRTEIFVSALPPGHIITVRSVYLTDIFFEEGAYDYEDGELLDFSRLIGRTPDRYEDGELRYVDVFLVALPGVHYSGVVLDSMGAPVPNATVFLSDVESYRYIDESPTDESGQFTVSARVYHGDAYSIFAQHNELGSGELFLDQGAEAMGTIEIRIAPKGRLSGVALSLVNTSLSGVHMVALGCDANFPNSEITGTTTVQSDGSFCFNGLPDGDWEIIMFNEVFGPFTTGASGLTLVTELRPVRIVAIAPPEARASEAEVNVQKVVLESGVLTHVPGEYPDDDAILVAPGEWLIAVPNDADWGVSLTVPSLDGETENLGGWIGEGVIQGMDQGADEVPRLEIEMLPKDLATL